MTIRVFHAGARDLVVGLTWRALSQTTAAARKQALRDARLLRPVKVYAPPVTRMIGFVPRAGLGKQKLPRASVAAAAQFAAMPNLPRTALLALPLPPADGLRATEAAIIGVHDGMPLSEFDVVVPLDDAASVAHNMALRLEREVDESPAVFGSLVLGAQPLAWETLADVPGQRLVGVTSPTLLPLALSAVALLAFLGHEGHQWYQKEQRRKAALAASSNKVDPEVAYGQSVATALSQLPWLTPDDLVLLVKSAGELPLDIGGFALDQSAGVECLLAQKQCTATYRRVDTLPATYLDVQREQKTGNLKGELRFGIDGNTVAMVFTPRQRDDKQQPPTRDALMRESELPLKVWPPLHAVASLPLTASLSQPSSILGQLPPDATEASLKQLVRSWPLTVKAPPWAAERIPQPVGTSWERAVLKFQPPSLELVGKIHAIKQ
jgi:hypothetical protein